MLYGRTYDPPGLATQEKVEEVDKAGIDTESFNSSLLQDHGSQKRDKTISGLQPYWKSVISYREPAN